MKKKRMALTSKAVIALIVFTIMIVVFTGLGIIVLFDDEILEHYRKSAYSYSRAAANYIDGDRIPHYLETLEKDDYYNDIQLFLNSMRDESDLEFYSVFVPFEDHIVYIWDAVTEGYCELGDKEEYELDSARTLVESICSGKKNEDLILVRSETYGDIAEAISPIYDKDGKPVALVSADLAANGIARSLIFYFLIITTVILVVSTIFTSLLFVWVKRRILKPIAEVNNAAKQMVAELEKREKQVIDLHTGDELEELADTFNHMNSDLIDYLSRLESVTAEKERIGAELSVATHIQADMLPSVFPPFPDRKEFDIFASMTPAKEVGGDFYDFFLIDDDHLALVIADVSGKGVPAALFMMSSKMLINNYSLIGGSPADIISDVNERICEKNAENMFVTIWMGILEISTGKMTCCNAGHENPVLRRTGGKYELVNDKHYLFVGTMPGALYKNYEIQLGKGDTLFVYTDGVPEATNADYELFGKDRMLDALNTEPEASPENILKNVKKSVDEFVGEAPQFDDLTMLGFTYFGTEE